MMLRFIMGAALLIASSGARADDYDWHAKANRLQMATIFEATTKVCAEEFGFSQLPALSKDEMAEKIDAYLLLRDDPDQVLQDWVGVFNPVLDLVSDKKDEATIEDDERGSTALVAAAKDPSVMAEAEERYVSGIMGPFRRALQACTVGVADPFLGKYYLSGTGSVDDIEKQFRDGFAKEVEDVRDDRSRRK